MNHFWVLVLLAMAAGICVPIQAGINVQLSQWARSPILAATISFAVGTLGLGLYCLVTRLSLPALNTASVYPWWIWTGGLLGAFFVSATIFLAPRLGATSMLAWLLAGQMLASLLLDHFGLLGFPEHPFSLTRLAGVVLLGCGVLLIRAH